MTSWRSVLVASTVLLFHCAEPAPCVRPTVDAGIDFADALAVLGAPVTLSAAAPLATCLSDETSARVTFLGPDNLPRELASSLELMRSSGGQLAAQVTFSPDEAGAWVVQVAFEPALGVSRRVLWVATPRGLDAPLARFTVPSTCVDAPWPLSAGGIACELETREVLLLWADGGSTRFDGEQLAVVDGTPPVLWLIHQGALERRDAQGTLLERFDGGSTLPIAGEHTATSAIRRVDTSTVGLFSADDGGRHVNLTQYALFENVMFHSENEVLRFDEAVWGLEPMTVWAASAGGGVEGFERPVVAGTLATWALRRAPTRGPFQQRPFTTLPLQFGQGDQRIVITPGARRLSVDAWPAQSLWRVGLKFVLLRDGDGKALLFDR